MYTIIEQENKNLFQKTLDDLKTQIKFVGTFGFGITGLYETIQELLYGKYPTLSEHEIILIFLAALSYFAIDVVDDVKKLTQTVKEKGLGKYLTQTIETLKDFENVAIEVGKRAGHTISSLAELVGYIYLLVPILETVQRLIAKEGFDIVTLGIYLKSILTSIGIFYTKNVFDKLIRRLKRDVPKDDKDVIKEHTERKDELRRVLDKYEKDYKRVSPELIIDLAIEDPSTDYDYLAWMVDQVKMGFFLGVDLKYISKLINKFHLHKEILTKGRLLRMLERFKISFPGPWVWNNDEILEQILEDPSDINNYPGYGQVEQILQMIDFSIGSSEPGSLGPDLQIEQLDYLQKKGEQSTRKVVSDILKIIKEPDSDEEFYHLPDYFSGIDGDMYEFGELEFNVYVNVVEYEPLEEPFIVDAEMGGDYDDEIYITITIGPEFSTNDYEDLQMVLNDYIRHEIEHVIDATEGGDIESPDNLSPYDYYMQPHEVRAQKAGFNRRAKLEKKPVEDIIYDYLEYRQKIDKLSDEQKSNLTKTLSEHKGKGERYNQPLEEGDIIELLYMDDPYNPISPLTRGVVMGFEKVPGGKDKILVTWIVDPENDKMFNMPMIPEVDAWRKLDISLDRDVRFSPVSGGDNRDNIGRPLREETDPTFADKVWDATKDIGKFVLKNNGLSWLIRQVVGTTPTKARLIFPKEGWETTAVKILENIGIVTGTYETLDEANNFFKDLKQNGCDKCLEELLIGSHGFQGNLLTTQKGGRKGYKKRWDAETRTLIQTDEILWETGMRYAFKTDFLEHIKPVVNPNTKVYFTACHGADKLTMLKEAADELGCECYACMGDNAFSFGCEDSNWSCNANTGIPSFEFSGSQSEDERAVITGEEGLSRYMSAKAYTKKVNDFYVEHNVCQEQPNIPFNWVTLFG